VYQVLLVDDEELIRKGLKNLLDWEALGFQICAEQKNGLQAFLYIKNHPVDLVIADIKMPHMSGIELAKSIHEEYPSIKVIILSGYGEFSYAQDALRLQVVQYLLKPVKRNTLKEALQQVKSLLDAQKITDEVLENKLINQIAIQLNEATEQSLSSSECLSPEKVFPHTQGTLFQILIYKFFSRYQALEQEIGSSLLLLRQSIILKKLQNRYKNGANSFAYTIKDGFLAILMSEKNESLLEQERLECMQVMREQEVSALSDGFIGILSDVFFEFNQTPLIIRTILGLVEPYVFQRPNEYYKIEDILAKPIDFTSLDSRSSAKAISAAIISTSQSALKKEVLVLFNSFVFAKVVQKTTIDHHLHKILLHCEDALKHFNESMELWGVQVHRLLNLFKTFNILGDYQTSLFDFLLYVQEARICDSVQQGRRKIIRLVEEQLQQMTNLSEVSLEVVAQKVGLSSNHFSRLFHQEMGITFKEYLIERKIEMAKTLLRDPYLKIYQISHAVGYKDVRYFSELFKEKTGLTPVVYREKSL